jgi:hypothetical protein
LLLKMEIGVYMFGGGGGPGFVLDCDIARIAERVGHTTTEDLQLVIT